jgi:hypothetical protein
MKTQKTAVPRIVFGFVLMVWTLAAFAATDDKPSSHPYDGHYTAFIDATNIADFGEACYYCVLVGGGWSRYIRQPKPTKPNQQVEWEGDSSNPYLVATIEGCSRNLKLSQLVTTGRWDATRMNYPAFPTLEQERYQREVEKLMTPEAHRILALRVTGIPTSEMMHNQ